MNEQSLHPTDESIAAAFDAMRAERQRIEDVTGVRIDDHGHVIPRLVVVPCVRPGCLFVAAADSEAQAIEKVERHISRRHAAVVVSIAERR